MNQALSSNDAIISVHELTRRFGSFVAVDRVTFEVGKGEIFGFLGANGAGKTTCIRMLTGLLSPTDGKASVAGFDVYSEAEKIKRNIGYMSQKFSLYEDLTVAENIRFYGGIFGLSRGQIAERTERLVDELGLTHALDARIKSLPIGWRQKLAFSVAILHEPRIVFLDEPTGGVDPITRRQFWDMIYKAAARQVTVFVTTHYLDEAEYCDRVAIMVDGKLAALDTPNGLKQSLGSGSMNDAFIRLVRGNEKLQAT